MTTEIRVPQLPESVADATLVAWHKQPGESFNAGDVLYEIETEKVTQEVTATASGTLVEVFAQAGETVAVGAPVCAVDIASAT